MLEDTPCGQDTFHGTIIVLNQRENNDAVAMNTSLTIPTDLPPKPLKVKLNYLDEPVIQQKPIRFTEYSIGQRNNLLSKYKSFTHTWLLANFMTIESSILKDDCGDDESVQLINVEDNDSVTSTFHSEIPLEMTERE